MSQAPANAASGAAPDPQPERSGLGARLARARRLRGPALVAAAAIGAAVLGWGIHSGRVTDWSGFDRAGALQGAERAADFLRTVRAQREKRPALDARLAGIANATLGDRLDAVDSALRARLNRIGEETGMRSLIVATSAAVERRNPARNEMGRMGLPRAMRDEPDFVEVRATLMGEGAVDQVLRLVHRISVDPMLKRIESVKLDASRDGRRVGVTLRLATIVVPGVAPTGVPGGPSAEALAGFAKYAVLAQRNPFRLPEPAAPTAAAPPAVAAAQPAVESAAPAAEAPAAPAGFPYAQWLLTGVIDGPAGTEAWFRNAATQESLVLRLNESIAEFSLVGLTPQGARIAAGGATYVVRVGDSLDARALESAVGGRPGDTP